MNGLFLFQEAVWLLSHRFYLTLYRGVCRSQPEEMHSGSSRWKYGANCSSCYYHKDVCLFWAQIWTWNLFFLLLFCFVFFWSCNLHCHKFLTGKRTRKLSVILSAVTLTAYTDMGVRSAHSLMRSQHSSPVSWPTSVHLPAIINNYYVFLVRPFPF